VLTSRQALVECTPHVNRFIAFVLILFENVYSDVIGLVLVFDDMILILFLHFTT